MVIPVYVSQIPHARRLPPRSVACPHCKQTVSAAVEVSWLLRSLWGIPVRAVQIVSTFDCSACGERSSLKGDLAGGNVPFMHEFGFIPLLAAVILIPIVILWSILPSGPKISYAEQTLLRNRGAALMAQAAAKQQACQDAIANGVKRAFPGGVLEAPPAASFIDIDLDKAPSVRLRGGKLEHTLCDRSLPGDPYLTPYGSIEENERRLKKLEAEVAAVKDAPAGFLVLESTCAKGRCTEALGVVSREGAVLGLAKRAHKGGEVPWIELKAEYQKQRAKRL